MTAHRRPLLVLALVAFGAEANAQILSLPTFTGDLSEGFESATPGIYAPCLSSSILSGTAELCTPSTYGANVAAQYVMNCTILPRTGGLCYGSVDGLTQIQFHEPIRAFGAWFAVSSAINDATVTFYDWNDEVIGVPQTAWCVSDCGWHWNAWEVSGCAIARLTIQGNSWNNGAFVQLDDIEVLRTNFVDTFCSGDGTGASCPCGNQGANGAGCANGYAPQGAALVALGNPSLAVGDMRLAASGLPPHELVVFAEGDQSGALDAPFLLGDGLRCIRGQLRRVEIGFSDASGAAQMTPSLLTQGQVAGSLRHYQLWYRDTFASPCSVGTNMTNAVSLVWIP